MGMRYEDFCGLTPGEFNACYKAHLDERENAYRDAWERVRILATITAQPHTKKKLTPRTLLPFPWEKADRPKTNAPKLTKDEARARFENLMKRSKTKGADV